jgi:C1A family cysteine protease
LRTLKTFFSLILGSLLLQGISAQNAPQGAPVNPEYISWLKDLQSGLITNITPDGHGLGYIPGVNNPDFSGYAPPTSPSTFPSVFDLRTTGQMSAVRDQGSCGACWAFATMGSMESRWKVLGLGEYDLSENNLKDCHLYDIGACTGGNFSMSAAYMSRRAGPVSEAADPYSASPQACLQGLDPQGYATSAWILPKNMAAIKQALMDYGAVYTTFCWNSQYYNASDYTYFYNGAGYSNHAVTIAGWDDNKVTAGGTGAWIIKNSWGPYWGENGYFYISYNDYRILSENGCFPTRLTYAGNTKIYNYDDFGMFSSWGFSNTFAYGLVKFVATNSWPVTKIGTWINASNATYDIEIYDNFNGTTLSGLLGSLSNQSSTYPGYYLFDLFTSIPMASGNDFYIKIKYTTPGYNFPIPIEINVPGYASNVTIQTGMCWWSSNGTSWSPIGGGTDYPYDLCIKAYTAEPPPVTRNWTGSVNGNWNNANNWNPAGIPSSTENVIIPASTPYPLVISLQGYSCHDMTILHNATVTIAPGKTITINGNLQINP